MPCDYPPAFFCFYMWTYLSNLIMASGRHSILHTFKVGILTFITKSLMCSEEIYARFSSIPVSQCSLLDSLLSFLVFLF